MPETVSPGFVIDSFARLNEKIILDRNYQEVSVTGIYEPAPDSARFQSGGYPDTLIDESDPNSRLTVILNAEQRAYLTDSNVVCLKGYLKIYSDKYRGTVKVQLAVTTRPEVVARNSAITKKNLEVFQLIFQKRSTGFKNVAALIEDSLRSGATPVILVIAPEKGITTSDMTESLGEYKKYFSFSYRKIPYTADNLARELYASDGRFDLVCLMRGGGEILSQLDSPELCERIIDMETPVVSALGHTEDNLLVNQVCDNYFGTPSIFGGFLKERARNAVQLKEQAEKSRLAQEDLKNQIAFQAEEYRQRRKRLIKNALIIGAVAVLLALGTGYLLNGSKAPVEDPSPQTVQEP